VLKRKGNPTAVGDSEQRRIIRGLQNGDAAAWQAFYSSCAERLWRWVGRCVGPSADVADVVQETFLAVARSVRSFDGARGALWWWVWGIARRQIALHYRRRAREQRRTCGSPGTGPPRDRLEEMIDGSAPPPSDAVELAELTARVREVVASLPREYGFLLVAKYLDGASVRELAEALGKSPAAVESKLARARRAFRDAFLKRTGAPRRCCDARE